MRRMFALILGLVAAFALAACGGAPAAQPAATEEPAAGQPAAPAVTSGALTISDPWVRPASPGATAATAMPAATPEQMEMEGEMQMGAGVNTAAYMTIANSGEADVLTGATVSPDLVDAVELHTVIDDGGVMQMRPVEQIDVPANGEVALEPGGFHVMLIGVKQELSPGDTVTVRLNFENAGEVEVDAVVRMAASMP